LGNIKGEKGGSTPGALPTISLSQYAGDTSTASSEGYVVTDTIASDGELIIQAPASGTASDTDVIQLTVGSTVIEVSATADDPEAAATAIADALESADLNLGISVDRSAIDAGKITLSSTTNSTGAGGLMTSSDAQNVIGKLDTAITNLNSQRAELGAVSNRLDNTVSNLTNVAINLEGGKGRIEDADFAAESTSLAKSQILQQASTAMLAQANASKQNVLSLLQG